MGGKSLVGLLRGGVPASSFNASYSQIQRGGNRQGISVRTDRWRYTEWVKFDYGKGLPIFVENNTDVELYDHLGDDENDFDAYENANAVSDPANAAVVAELAAALRWMHRDTDPSPAPVAGFTRHPVSYCGPSKSFYSLTSDSLSGCAAMCAADDKCNCFDAFADGSSGKQCDTSKPTSCACRLHESASGITTSSSYDAYAKTNDISVQTSVV